MAERADVIIGGGVVGESIAFYPRSYLSSLLHGNCPLWQPDYAKG